MVEGLKKIALGKNVYILLFAIGFLYTFPVFNKFWAPYDEGVITVAAQRLLAGEVPYKDFFILMYPPGQIYLLAAIFKLFSSPLIAGRIYTVLISSGIALLTYCSTFLLTGRRIVAILSWAIVLLASAPRLGAIPAPIWPGIFLGLLTILLFTSRLKNLNCRHILCTGLCAGVTALFRHDIGIFAAASVLITLLIKGMRETRHVFREGMVFVSGVLFVILPCAIYFIKISAMRDMYNSLILFPLILFPSVHQGAAGLPFPGPCIDLNMIFHGSLHFIKVNQFYIPVLVYLFCVIYLSRLVIKKRALDTSDQMMFPFLLFGIFTFNQVRIRTDVMHLLTVIQPAVILFGFMIHKTLSYKPGSRIKKMTLYIFTAAILFLFVLLSIKNADKYVKNSFRKVYKKDIIKTHFDVGTIYIPKDERRDVTDTVNFIKENTHQKERIFIGNSEHWKDDFGGSTIIYLLADRLPSTKFYELVPGIQTSPEVQKEIKESIIRHNVLLLVLQDIDMVGLRREDTHPDKLILDDFIARHFKRAEKFGKYGIYIRR
ncbi:MAG: hypothetical protein ABID09_00010 [Candidatus Omnitrophota bacterium]